MGWILTRREDKGLRGRGQGVRDRKRKDRERTRGSHKFD